MQPSITFNGISAASLGIVVTELPELLLAEERAEYTEVPGRNGAVRITQGEDIYKDITVPVKMFVYDTSKVREISAWLKGAGELRLSNRPGGYYKAAVVNQLPFEKIMAGKKPRSFTVNFRCNPCFYLNSGDTQILPQNGSYIENPTGFTALPIISIAGSGDITLMVGQTIVQLSDIEGGITIDSRIEEAYWTSQGATTLKNTQMTGEFPTLPAGRTAISWTGTTTRVEVKPGWWTR